MKTVLILIVTTLTLSACENTRKNWIDVVNSRSASAGERAGR